MAIKNLVVSSSSINTTSNGKSLSYVLTPIPVATTQASGALTPPMMMQPSYQDTIQSPSSEDIETFTYGALVTLTLAPTPVASSVTSGSGSSNGSTGSK